MEIGRLLVSSGCATFWPMSLRWCGAVIDCHDARAQSRWWAEVLGWQIAAEDDDGIVTVLPPHLADATREIPVVAPPDGGDKEAEVRRLKALGATVVAVGEGGLDLVIMEDPEGNGFSVVGPRG